MIELLRNSSKIISSQHRRHAVALIGLLVCGAVLELAAVGLLLPAIELMQDPSTVETSVVPRFLASMLGLQGNDSLFVWMFLLCWLVYLVKNFCLVLINRFQFAFFADLQSSLSKRLFSRYLHNDYEFFVESNSAVLVRSVSEDIKNVVVLIVFASITIVTEAFVAIPLFLFIVWLNPLIALMTVVVGLICFAMLSRFVSKSLKKVGEQNQKELSRLIQSVNEGVGAIKELKVLAREDYYQSAFEQRAVNYARGLGRYLFYNSVPRLVLEAVFVLVFVGLLLILSLDGNLRDSLPTLAVYAAVSFRLIPGLNRAAGAFNSLHMGQASLNVVVEGLSNITEHKHEVEAVSFGPVDQLSLADVSYAFANGHVALRDINISISRGETIGIVGESGAGKTTLIDLILGLLAPTEGAVLLNGININKDLGQWQQRLGYVPQSVFLADGSIRSNVALGVDESKIDDDRVWAALRGANLEAFVRSSASTLDVPVGERGVKFSGGQRQRVGIARALYRQPEVLILDEATSALDAETEKQVMKEVAGLPGDVTVIIIAHRISTLAGCDRVYVLNAGGIEATKTYAEIA